MDYLKNNCVGEKNAINGEFEEVEKYIDKLLLSKGTQNMEENKKQLIRSYVFIGVILFIFLVALVLSGKLETEKMETQYNELLTENERLNEIIDDNNDSLYVREKLLHYLIEYGNTNIEDFEMWLYLNHKEWYLENYNK